MVLVFRKVYKNKMTSQNYVQEFQETMTKWKGYKPYFGLYKRSFMHQSHMIIFFVRIFFFSLFLSTLFEYPVVQAVLAMLMSLGMIAYLLITRPFIKTINTIGQIVLEILLFSYYICVLALAISDSNGNSDLESRERIGTVMMVFSFFAQIFTFLFALLKAVMLGIKLYKQTNDASLKIRLDVEVDLEQEERKMKLNNSMGSNKTFLNDGNNNSTMIKAGSGAEGNKDIAISVLDQSVGGLYTHPSDQEFNNGNYI